MYEYFTHMFMVFLKITKLKGEMCMNWNLESLYDPKKKSIMSWKLWEKPSSSHQKQDFRLPDGVFLGQVLYSQFQLC